MIRNTFNSAKEKLQQYIQLNIIIIFSTWIIKKKKNIKRSIEPLQYKLYITVIVYAYVSLEVYLDSE